MTISPPNVPIFKFCHCFKAGDSYGFTCQLKSSVFIGNYFHKGLKNRATNISIKFINSLISAAPKLWKSHALSPKSSEANEDACPTKKKTLLGINSNKNGIFIAFKEHDTANIKTLFPFVSAIILFSFLQKSSCFQDVNKRLQLIVQVTIYPVSVKLGPLSKGN